MPIAIAIASLYLLQACGGANYNSYVAEFQEIAMNEMERTGYPASIKLAQAILESEGGRGKLAFEYNNHFGIICGKNWPGKKYYQEEEDFNSGEIIETCYRAYNNPFSSFIAHTDLLKGSKHYKSLFRLDPSDYTGWAEKLNELEYTDNDTYGSTLISMIEKYELYQFDDMVTGKTRTIASTDTEADYQENTDERPYRNKRIKDRVKDEIEDLEEDIKNHRSKRTKRERSESWAEEDSYRAEASNTRDRQFDYDNYMRDVETYEQEDQYADAPYRKQNYEEYEDEEIDDYRERPYKRSPYETKERYSDYDELESTDRQRPSRAYEEAPTRYKRSSSKSNDIDSKYEGLGDMYAPNPVDYSASDYRDRDATYRDRDTYKERDRNRDTYQTPSRNSRDNWEGQNYETSISDFETPEDYAYINGTKVTIARYDDTPLLIAARYNVSVRDVIKYNEHLKSNKQLLREGTKVFLAAKKKNYEDGKSYHEVQFGERMEDIAQLYGLSLTALYEKNRMPENSEPALGERIKLNRGKAKRRPELRAHYRSNHTNPASVAPSNHTAIPNRVAIKERPSKTIKTKIVDNYPNNVANRHQSPVTTVLLQPVTTDVMYHTVQEGETLYRIARKYSTTAAVIRSMNNLQGNTISKGSSLKIR